MNNILAFTKKKQHNEKIVMVTCYDHLSAKIISESDIDCILIGDSGVMTTLGKESTVYATIEEMELMTKAVSSAKCAQFLIADLPFLSYRSDLDTSISSVKRLMQAGAQAVKLEGAIGNLLLIEHLYHSGIPVMGHLGLTPQHIHQLGGYKIQGKQTQAAEALIEQSKQLEQAGCFALVLECVPHELAKHITDELAIPTIGIGAGPNTDGQVLVWHDLLGFQTDFHPKFVKQYFCAKDAFKNSLNQYAQEVRNQVFPSLSHSYQGEAC